MKAILKNISIFIAGLMLISISATGQSIPNTITGTLYDENTGPIPGATLVLQGPGTVLGAVTDEEGRFIFAGIPNTYCGAIMTIQFSYTGYFDRSIQYYQGCEGVTQTVNIYVTSDRDPLLVTNTDDDGPGSLRQAILDANSNSGKDYIYFDIPIRDWVWIAPLSSLPAITEEVVINGFSQPGSEMNNLPAGTGLNTLPKIILIGGSAGTGAAGLNISADNCEIKGIVIDNFDNLGITISSDTNIVRECFIGTDSTGHPSAFNGNDIYGIRITGGIYNEITNCVVSGNGAPGQSPNILITGGSAENRIYGNLIGTDLTGTVSASNTASGIIINSSPENIVGGLSDAERNVIFGGVQLLGVATIGNTIVGNYIGPDVSGLIDLGSGGAISVRNGANGNEIGPDNVISGNPNNGIGLTGNTTHHNVVFGNYLGVAADGNTPMPNESANLIVLNAPDNQIGGLSADSANVISGSTSTHGISISGPTAVGNKIIGNFIGTNAAGDQPIGNAHDGIHILQSGTNNVIGPGNLISGNGRNAVYIDLQADNTIVKENLIGTDYTGNSLIGNQGNGIIISQSSNNTVQGNTICGAGSGSSGVEVSSVGTNDNIIIDNYIGTNASSQPGLGNGGAGIYIGMAVGTRIENNVISGNGLYGINLYLSGTSQTSIISNKIGTNVSGDAALGNGQNGIQITNSQNNTIGPDNVISGNGSFGIRISGISGSGNKIIGNLIGTNANGSAAIPNMFGISVWEAEGTIIGGTAIADRNIISGNEQYGINTTQSATNTRIMGNFIGTDISGKLPIPNSAGIFCTQNSTENYIGTGNGGAGNLIAFNSTGISIHTTDNYIQGNIFHDNNYGISLMGNNNTIGGADPLYGNYFYKSTANGIIVSNICHYNLIEGNFFGLDPEGQFDLTNGVGGIRIDGSDNIIKDNLLSGYSEYGIRIGRAETNSIINSGNLISGNRIGLNAAGDGYIPNEHGIILSRTTDNVLMGNVIAGNSGNGIQVFRPTTINNQFSRNLIYNNGELGIDLNRDGVTENDLLPLDPDVGPNNLQNFPVLDSIHFAEGKVTIKGRLRSESNRTYIIEFFSSNVADATGYGEGEYYLGVDTVYTDGLGNALFETTLATNGYGAQVITATATDEEGNTSEFSQAIGGVINQVLAEMPFYYTLNNEGLSTVPLVDYQNAIHNAFQTWDTVLTAEIEMEYAGSSDEKYASATDEINLVSFQDDHFPFPKGVLAVTAKTLQISAGGTEAEILDADIIFNPAYILDPEHAFAILDEGDTVTRAFDIQSVATHEIGHVLGMIHSGVYSSTMFFMLGYGTTERELGTDDMAWASYRYPNGYFLPNHGMISGRVTYGDLGDVAVPSSHPPVAGALVLAIDTDTQEKFHAYTDADGNYTVPIYMVENETDEYWIHIQPLDGDVYGTALNPSNISPYIYSHTMFTDFPDEFYDALESYNDNPGHGEPILVSAGGTVSGIDLITNRDLTSPTVLGVFPAQGDTGIAVSPTLVLKFSEPVDIFSFDENSCFLENSGEIVEGDFTILADSTHIMLMTPVEALQYSTPYTLHIDGITDLKDNALAAPFTSSFTTQAPDTIAPYVYDVIPADEAVQVDVTKPLKVFFSEAMNKNSAESGFMLMTSDSELVEGSFDWDPGNKEMTYTPDFSLMEGTAYIISLSTQVTDLSGNAMEYDTSFTFSTVDVAAPQILYLGPGDGNSGVTVTTPVVVKVSEPLDVSTITSISFALTGIAGQVNGNYEYLDDNRTIVFRPDQDLQFNQSYTITLSSDISDISDPTQYLQATTATFQTAPATVVPHITYMDPPFGAAGAQTTIVGSGFDPVPWNNVVSCNGVPATVKKSTLESVTVLVPVIAYSGPVTLTVNGVAADNSFEFDVVDPNTDPSYSVLASATTGSRTRAVVINPDAGYAYVTNWGDNTVTAIDISVDIPVPVIDIQVGIEPMDIDLNPNGTLAYVTNFLSNTVSVIGTDPANTDSLHQVVNDIPVGYHPYGVAASSDKKVYVANNESEYVSVIDMDPSSGGFDHVIANVKTGSKNRSIVVTPDAGLILVTGDDGVAIIDRDPGSPTFNDVIARASAGSTTRHVTITPDAALALATTEDGVILIIDIFQPPGTQFGNVIASVKTGSSARNITISPDAMYVYITNPDDNTVSVYQLDYSIVPGYGASLNNALGLEHITTIEVDAQPYAIVGHPSSEYLLVTHDSDEGGVSKIGIEEESVNAIHTLNQLIASVENALEAGLIPVKFGKRLLEDLQIVRDRIENGQLASALDNINVFIRRLQRYMSRGGVPEDLGNAWLEAAYRIRDQLLLDYEAQNSELKGSGEAGSDSGALDDPQSISGNEKDPVGINSLKLENRPNPFSNNTLISFEIPENGEASVPVLMKVYNTSGQVIKTLVHMNMEPGRYSVRWNCDLEQGGLAPNGIYLLELTVPDQRKAIRISVMR